MAAVNVVHFGDSSRVYRASKTTHLLASLKNLVDGAFLEQQGPHLRAALLISKEDPHLLSAVLIIPH